MTLSLAYPYRFSIDDTVNGPWQAPSYFSNGSIPGGLTIGHECKIIAFLVESFAKATDDLAMARSVVVVELLPWGHDASYLEFRSEPP